MHVAAGTREWFATSADKILFHSIVAGVGPRTPKLFAATQIGRYLPDGMVVTDWVALAGLLTAVEQGAVVVTANGREFDLLLQLRPDANALFYRPVGSSIRDAPVPLG